MADLMRNLGWIAWCLTVIGWFLSPIISLLVSKLFVDLVFDASTKLKELEIYTIPKLKQTLSDVEEQTVLRAAEDKESQCNLKILDTMKKDLKCALYEAEDILDLLEYRRIEKHLHLGDDDDSRWVENQLGAACTWIARCKGSSFGRWIHVTLATVMKSAQSMIRQGQLVIQGWRHSRQNIDLVCFRRAINIAGAAVLQCAQSWYQQLGQLFRSSVLQCTQSWYQQLGQLFRSVILSISGVPLLPVSINPSRQPPSLESGSEFVPADPARRPAEKMVDEEEIVEETQVEEGEGDEIQDGEEGAMLEGIEEERSEGGEGEETSEEEIQDGEEGAMLEEIEEESSEGGDGEETSEEVIQDGEEEAMLEEIEEESCEGGEGEETSEEEIQEDDEEGEEGEPTSLSILRYCARSMLTWFAKACFYRDWSYGIVGIKSDKKDASAVESLVPITQRISLKNRIKHIEDILNTSKKSDLLNDENSSSGTTKDNDKESSSFTVKNRAKESSSEQKQIDVLYRSIEQKVFGREENRAHISRMLRKGPDTDAPSSSTVSPYSVIGIYGITGSGKTTLAQYVCHYEKGEGHFNPIMFILVGKKFSIGDVFRDMLEQITQRWPNDKDLKSLKEELEEKLKDKCFLLVLDDLWVNDENQKEWDILLDTLSAALRGSRVLVTSQKKDAAQALGAHEQISIPDLEEGVYLSLFMHHARPDASADDGEYERIGRKIANRLGRSPIAAVTVGKQLQRNKNISFWETTANLDVLNKTMGALWWSYQQLGDDIRRCFAYCSTFPKGYLLRRDELIRMWIAQGFINTRSNAKEELEDVGQRYFDELLTFSFLQKECSFQHKEWKFSKQFRIHDLLHELAKRISGSEFDRIGLNGSPDDIPRGVDHLFIETKNVAEINEKNLDLQNLRTLIINEDRYVVSPDKTIKRNHDIEKLLGRLFMRLTKLRVLIIRLNYIGKQLSVPASIDQMKHLRYLAFHFALILPSTFSKLYHIQTIDIRDFITSWPPDMANLIYLRDGPAVLNFPNIGRLTSLQRLLTFRVKEEQGYGLKQLMHLNKIRGSLSICGLDIVGSKEEALEAHLTHKERLRELELVFRGGNRVSPGVQAEVLEGLCPPKDLQELHIEDYRGSRYPSWMLSRHHSEIAPKHLHRLDLHHCSQLASIPEDSELFIGLRELIIYGCNWDRLPQNMERLVSLQKLDICGCNEIELLPTLPHQALKKITIGWCRVLSGTCIEEGHDNWHKIQHIPEKYISGMDAW